MLKIEVKKALKDTRLLTDSNINEPGKWVMVQVLFTKLSNQKLNLLIKSTSLECSSHFETECPEPLEGSRTISSTLMTTKARV